MEFGLLDAARPSKTLLPDRWSTQEGKPLPITPELDVNSEEKQERVPEA